MRGFVDVHSHVVPVGRRRRRFDRGRPRALPDRATRRARRSSSRPLTHTRPGTVPADGRARPAVRDVARGDAQRGRRVGARPPARLGGLPERDRRERSSRPRARGHSAVLIEFPGSWLDIEDPIAVVVDGGRAVEAAGLVPVLAHPERCRAVADDPESVRPLAERGWLLCLNAPSLVGGHGDRRGAHRMGAARRRIVALVASDGHSGRAAADPRRRVPGVREQLRRGDRAAAVRRERASLGLA